MEIASEAGQRRRGTEGHKFARVTQDSMRGVQFFHNMQGFYRQRDGPSASLIFGRGTIALVAIYTDEIKDMNEL
jgi:hypothetical protein